MVELDPLSRPAGSGPKRGPRRQGDAFGRVSETVARSFGTARYLVAQTVVVVLWIALNSVAFVRHWDGYPYRFLNLVFTVQAAYAAPLILLAATRQNQRDAASTERNRANDARLSTSTAYLVRELSTIRLTLTGAVRRDDLPARLDALQAGVEELYRSLPVDEG